MKSNKKLKVVSLTTLAAACVLSGVFALNANTAAAAEDTFHEVGASIRVSSQDKGIRFAFGLPEKYTGEGYEIGTLVIPKEELVGNVLNHNDDTADETDEDYLEIKCEKFLPDATTVKGAKEGYKYYNVALTEIPDLHYNTVLVARSYYKDSDGKYVYSDPVERSIGYVASAVLNSNPNAFGADVIEGIVSTGFGETEVEVDFEKDLLSVNDTTTFEVTNTEYKAVWSSSNENVATVDKDGVVKAVKGGETTITAKIGNQTASQQVYVVGDGLYSDQIGTRANGWNYTNKADWFTLTTENNGDMSVTVKFNSNPNCLPMLMVRNLHSKAYYQALIDNQYVKFAFNLTVGGDNANDVEDLYVFGKALTSFPQNSDGSYAVVVDTNQFVSYYDTMYTLATSGDAVGAKTSIKAMLLAWDFGSTWNTVRNYKFTFSNVVFEKPTLSVDFAKDNIDLIEAGKTTTLTAVTNMGEVEWSSSNENVATVQNGVVTGVKSGVATITATVGELTASKTVYVKANALYSDQIGTRANGWNYTNKADWFTLTTENNGDMSVAVKFNSNPNCLPMLMVRNLHSKAYYERLIADEYTQIKFNLTVGGNNANDVEDLYVFGKALTSFPQNNGVYAISIDVQHFVSYYDTMYTLATSGDAVGAKTSIKAMLLAWDFGNTWNTVRNYVFTISNPVFSSDAFSSNQFAVVSSGWNQPSFVNATVNNNNDIVIEAKFQGDQWWYPAVVLRNLESEEFYQGLIKNGYTKLTFDLAIGEANAEELYIFDTKLSTFEQTNGVYHVSVNVQHIVDNYATIGALGTSYQARPSSYRTQMLIMCQATCNPARNYVFTISNSAYTKA